MATLDDVRRIALDLPGAYEHASHGGASSFRTKPRAFAFHREELDALAVHVASEEDKHALIAAAPEVFFTTPHYDGYSAVLVRLAAVTPDELAELVIEAWRLRAPKRDVGRWDEEHPAPS
jgi:hypothetical protein